MNFPMESKIAGLVKNDEVNNFIFGREKNYIIPEYQREYSWGEVQIESFITSIKRAIDGENVFMGTVQFACESKNPSELHVIDGQQRMTTFLLFCSLLEKHTGKQILSPNNMSLNIRNFKSNDDKLKETLDIKYEEIGNTNLSNNRYLDNAKILKASLEELEQDYTADKITESVYQKIYFVELITKDIPLPQVVGIFNTINTTGLVLNCSDIFKLQYYEYLKKAYPDTDNIMSSICEVYENVNKENKDMSNILDIYKHCIVAKYKLGWNMLSQSNEAFFDEIFEKKEPEPKADILKFEEFKKIVNIYLNPLKKENDTESMSSFSEDVIWCMTRYGRYWTLPYVATYFNGGNYEKALNTAMNVAKYLIVCSVNFDKAINPVQTFMCNTILPAIAGNEPIEDMIKGVICEAPYEWRKDYPIWNKNKFIERIKYDLFSNGKRAYIVCTLSALLEEYNAKTKVCEIRSKLFDWKNFQYDKEHICAHNIFKDKNAEYHAEFNGIGNLVVLNRSINRDIGDKPIKEKVKEYKNSSKYKKEPRLVSVSNVTEQIEKNNGVWEIEQVRERQKQQEKLLCDFLGLND